MPLDKNGKKDNHRRPGVVGPDHLGGLGQALGGSRLQGGENSYGAPHPTRRWKVRSEVGVIFGMDDWNKAIQADLHRSGWTSTWTSRDKSPPG